MKNLITKLFKLDEPLGSKRFSIYFIILIVLINLLYLVSEYYYEPADRITIFFLFPFIILVARRLKDIEANQLFAGLFLIPLICWLIVAVDQIYNFQLMTYYNIDHIFLITLTAIAGFAPFFIFLLYKKGTTENVFSKKRKGIMRKNTLIITIGILFFFSIPVGVIFVTEYQLNSSRKDAIKIVVAVDKFKEDNGLYPEKLEELVPKYIDKIPNNKGRFFVSEEFSYNVFNGGKCARKPFYWIIINSKLFKYDMFSSEERVWTE